MRRSKRVKPGDTVAIGGSGPIGLAALLAAQFKLTEMTKVHETFKSAAATGALKVILKA